jgi:hypothetical protein
VTAAHGTVGRYKDHKCRCSDCREAVRQQRIGLREMAAANGGTYPGPITHGGAAYRNYGCRCEECTAANSASQLSAQVRRNAATAANGGVAPTETHGTSTYQNWGCRCDVCRADSATYLAGVRARRRARRQAQPA